MPGFLVRKIIAATQVFVVDPIPQWRAQMIRTAGFRRSGRAYASLVAGAMVLAGLTTPAVGHAAAADRVRVVVELTAPPALAAAKGLAAAQVPAAAAVQAGRNSAHDQQRRLIDAAGNGNVPLTVRARFTDVYNGLAVEVPRTHLDRLAALPGVAAVHPDREFRVSLDDSVPLIRAPQVWERRDDSGHSLDGTGQIVAVVDTGIDYSHPDLGGGFGPGHRVVAGHDFINNDGDPMDDNAHGTHVAATVAGRASQPGGVTGVAPGAQLTAYKVLDSRGWGTTATVLAGLEAAVAVDNPYRASVVNFSLGADPQPEDPLADAANTAVDAGVVVVAAAGNFGPREGSVSSPASAQNVLAVGASTSGIRVPVASLIAPVSRDLRPQRHWASANPAETPTQADVVDVGFGTPEDFTGKDVAGKAVLVPTSGAGDWEIARRAEEHGAVAVLFHLPEWGLPDPEITARQTELPQAAAWEDGRPDRIVSMWVSRSDATEIKRALATEPVRIRYGGVAGDDQLADFSSRGPTPYTMRLKPELTAPGVEIRSAVPKSLWSHGYYRFSGTSMATPHVAGAAAILRQEHPQWTPRHIGAALTGTASPVHGADALGQGAGRLDLAAASDATVLAENWAVDFGVADLAESRITGTAQLSLVNNGAKPATVRLRAHPAPGSEAASISLSPTSVQLAPGARVTVAVSLAAPRPLTRQNLTGWIVAETEGQPALRVPYLSMVRPLYMQAMPDPTVGEATIGLGSELALDGAPTVTITPPNGRSVTQTATPHEVLGWAVRYTPRQAGIHRVSAVGRTEGLGVTLYQESTFEAVLGTVQHNWESVGPNNDGGMVVLAPADPRRAYVLPSRGVGLYRTDDRGQSWSELRNVPAQGIGSGRLVVADPRQPATVYLAVNGGTAFRGRVYVSQDAGQNWRPLSLPDTAVRHLAIDQTGSVLAVAGEAEIYLSRDRGDTWTTLAAPSGVTRMVVVGRDLYLATFGGLYVIRDVTGEPRQAEQLGIDSWVSGLAGDESLLLAAVRGTVRASTDRGVTWRTIFPTADASGWASGVALVGDRIAVTSYNQAWLGDRSGAHWSSLKAPQPDFGYGITSIGQWSGTDTLVLGVTMLGVFATTDRGETYQRIGVPSWTYSLGLAKDPDGSTVLLAGTGKGSLRAPLPVGATADAQSREWGFSGLEPQFLDHKITALAVSPADPRVVYRARSLSINQFFVEKSTDGGSTWQILAMQDGRPGALVVHPADPNRIYLAMANTADAGVMVSRDGGTIWRRIAHANMDAVAVDPRHPDTLWLGGSTGLYRSTDGGETVQLLDPRPVSAIAVDPRDPDRLLVGGDRLRYSRDGGRSLTDAGYADLTLDVNDIVIASDGTAYAATGASGRLGGRGVLYSRDGGLTWVSVSAGLPNRDVQDILLSPDEEWLFAATATGGVYRTRVHP